MNFTLIELKIANVLKVTIDHVPGSSHLGHLIYHSFATFIAHINSMNKLDNFQDGNECRVKLLSEKNKHGLTIPQQVSFLEKPNTIPDLR